MDLFSPKHLLILILVYAIACYPFAVIFRRAGRSGWLSLLMLVPLVNIVMIWWFAYAKWPTTAST
jgi:uncharacterized membrane protein YhaH (DUF805 family)